MHAENIELYCNYLQVKSYARNETEQTDNVVLFRYTFYNAQVLTDAKQMYIIYCMYKHAHNMFF